MTKQEWKTVDETLSILLQHVELEADGYKVDLVLRPVSRWRNAIIVTINGEFKSEWCSIDCEASRRFFRHRRVCLLSKKDFQKMGLSNVHQIEVLKKENTIDLWSRTWTDFRKMKKHFIENNNNISLIKVSTL